MRPSNGLLTAPGQLQTPPQVLFQNRRALCYFIVLLCGYPCQRRTLDPDGPAARVERAKSALRAKVEHPFRTVKRHFGYDKVRYRGQHKNRQRLALLLGFHNLLRAAPCLAA